LFNFIKFISILELCCGLCDLELCCGGGTGAPKRNEKEIKTDQPQNPSKIWINFKINEKYLYFKEIKIWISKG